MAFGRKAAEKLDAAARGLHEGGKKVAGRPGGRAGDAVANTFLAPVRGLINEPCTCSDDDCGH